MLKERSPPADRLGQPPREVAAILFLIRRSSIRRTTGRPPAAHRARGKAGRMRANARAGRPTGGSSISFCTLLKKKSLLRMSVGEMMPRDEHVLWRVSFMWGGGYYRIARGCRTQGLVFQTDP